jgi:hypothetical protein
MVVLDREVSSQKELLLKENQALSSKLKEQSIELLNLQRMLEQAAKEDAQQNLLVKTLR